MNDAQHDQALAVWQELWSLLHSRERIPSRRARAVSSPAPQTANGPAARSGIERLWKQANPLMQPLQTSQLRTLEQLTEERLASLTTRLRSISRFTCVTIVVLGAVLLLLTAGSVIPPIHVAPALPIIVLALPLLPLLYVVCRTWVSMQRAHNLLALIATALLIRNSGGDIAASDSKI